MGDFFKKLQNLFVKGASLDGPLFDSCVMYLRERYHVPSVIGPLAHSQIKNQCFTLEIDTIKLEEGRARTTDIFTVLAMNPYHMEDYYKARRLHDIMIRSYHNQRFTVSASFAKELIGQFDGQMDEYYQMWRIRCADLAANPPGRSWDGVYSPTN